MKGGQSKKWWQNENLVRKISRTANVQNPKCMENRSLCKYRNYYIEVYITLIYNERRKWRLDQPELSEVQVTVNIVSDILFSKIFYHSQH